MSVKEDKVVYFLTFDHQLSYFIPSTNLISRCLMHSHGDFFFHVFEFAVAVPAEILQASFLSLHL